MEEMRETVIIWEGERSRKIPKQRAIIKALVARTLKGDARAANTLVSVLLRVLDPESESAIVGPPLNREERDVLQSIKTRLLSNVHPIVALEAGDDDL